MSIDQIPVNPPAVMRRAPTQARARAKVERLTAEAERLVAERGAYGFSMRELAAAAAQPIASVYQYFPNQDAVIGTLIQRHHDAFNQWLRDRFADVATLGDLHGAIEEGLHAWVRLYAKTPAYRALWSGAQNSALLRELDGEDTKRNASVLEEALRRVMPEQDPATLAAAALLLCDTTGSTTRLATACEPEEGGRLLSAFLVMARTFVEQLAAGSGGR